MALATADDVEARLGRVLTDEESARADPGLLDEASDLVIGHLDADPTTDDGVPPPVTRVVARMVARVLQQTPIVTGGGAFGATSATDQIGDFSQTRTWQPGSTSGGPWLTAADKKILRPFGGSGSAFTVDTAPVGTVHSDACSINLGADYCSCGAALTGAGPLWEQDY